MKKLALCIGINNYPGFYCDLSGCVNDAQDWQKELISRGFKTQTLLNKKARKNIILRNISKLIKKAKNNDLIVIIFSGHGTWIPDENNDELDGRDECLCPWDILTTGAVISDDEISKLFATAKNGTRIILISDSCHSGTLTKMLPLTKPKNKIKYLAGSNFLKKAELKNAQKFLNTPKRKRNKDNCLLLSGCMDNEYSYDAYINNRFNGALSRVALDCLKGNPKTYKQWYGLIRKKLPSQEYPQTPQLIGTNWMKKLKIFE